MNADETWNMGYLNTVETWETFVRAHWCCSFKSNRL